MGHSYGRRTMHGLLQALGITASQSRVGEALSQIFPFQHSLRHLNVEMATNPHPYTANYFGEKVHLDQNEKLAMYGVIHVVAVDGYSRKIVGLVTIPRKNPIAIYNTLFRPLLCQHGLWDQVRTDHGTEFALVATVQQLVSDYRRRHSRHPVFRTTSRQNHRAERIWPEINRRINYPLKEVLVAMENAGDIDMTDNVVKFCVSWVTIKTLTPAIEAFVSAWNCHRIPGRNGGIPNMLARANNQVTPISRQNIPSLDQAISAHENNGGCLTPESCYGQDPIIDLPGLQLLRERFFVRVPKYGCCVSKCTS